jgi:hypothetical protein
MAMIAGIARRLSGALTAGFGAAAAGSLAMSGFGDDTDVQTPPAAKTPNAGGMRLLA